jgi:vacuolar-type H+-ATPase subunit H
MEGDQGMSNSSHAGKADAAAAIDQVLVAETAAREAMEACRQEAEEILEAAREDARRIARRAAERASGLHARCDLQVQQRIAGILDQARHDAPRAELDDADRDALAKAVESLAVRLTCTGHG